ncbi:ATP-binding protein [Lysobacter sp. KIS68-7]|uniref:ATP-binding protein n=1 Tax=Lysobacter sp. KIS68-7 TaxID=2904252 RepID=UPI001E410104|nr:ATP-binding protein [Lysobacter sp. KIS68-7]UHQ19110.1 ATP-binding protein [Lysobacter sp. KIS68-7]
MRASLDRVRLDLALQAAKLVVWTWDMATDEFEMSEADRAYVGLAPDHTLAAQTFAMMHPDDVAPSMERVERTRRGEHDVPIEFRLPDGRGGWRWWVGEATRFGEGDLPWMVGVCYDDTDRRDQEEALRRSEEAARAAAEEKARFLATMSHEIRTPMNGVIGMVELLSHTALDDKQRRMLDTCRDSAQVLLALLNDVLDFSKIEAGKVELETLPLSPGRMVEDLGVVLRAQAMERGIDVDVEVDEAVPALVEGDRVRLRQILANLGGNAVKFTERGRVTLSVSPDRQDPADPRVRLRFDVADTGIGIPPQALATLFEPFRQADASTTRRFGGTGLGLSIVRHLVDLMDGTLECESREGEGSRFRVSLPFVRASADAIVAERARAQAPRIAHVAGTHPALSIEDAARSGRLVLLADDNATNREVITQQLERLGYACEAVEDGEAAWTRIVEQRTRYALLLTDVQMPKLDGLALAARIREHERTAHLPPLSIVAITAGATSGDGERCLAAGMDAFLAKPVQLEPLRDAIARALPPIQGFDALSRIVHDDRDKLRRILAAFATDTRQDLERWRLARAPLDRATLGMLAHRLRSACLTLGADEAAQLLDAIEHEVTDPSVADAAFGATADRAGARVAALLADIERALGGLSSPA